MDVTKFDIKEDLIPILLSAGMDPNFKNSEVNTLLHITKNINIAKILIDSGADIDARNLSGNTALFYSVSKSIDLMKLFLEHGANPNFVYGFYKETLIHSLIKTRKYKFIHLLIDFDADINIADNNGNTPLHLLINLNDDDERTFLELKSHRNLILDTMLLKRM